VHTDARRHGYTLDHLVRWLCAAPARLAGFEDRAGALLPGREANFVIFDPEASRTIMVDDLHFQHPVSPYVGQTLAGRVHATYLRAQPVYADDVFSPVPRGHELRTQVETTA
jgi:allantoinase